MVVFSPANLNWVVVGGVELPLSGPPWWSFCMGAEGDGGGQQDEVSAAPAGRLSNQPLIVK